MLCLHAKIVFHILDIAIPSLSYLSGSFWFSTSISVLLFFSFLVFDTRYLGWLNTSLKVDRQ